MTAPAKMNRFERMIRERGRHAAPSFSHESMTDAPPRLSAASLENSHA